MEVPSWRRKLSTPYFGAIKFMHNVEPSWETSVQPQIRARYFDLCEF